MNPMLDIQADPYAGFISRVNDRKILARTAEYDLSSYPRVLDTGHPFLLEKWEAGTSSGARRWNWSGNSAYPQTTDMFATYGATPVDPSSMPFKFLTRNDPLSSGGSIVNTFGPVIQAPATSFGIALADFGRQAMARVAPGRPPLDLFRAAGEIFTGLPKLPGAALSTFVGAKYLSGPLGPQLSVRVKADPKRSIVAAGHDVSRSVSAGSGEFLNYLFGVAPTLTDLIQIGFGLASLSTSLLQLQRDHGRGVRRTHRGLPISQSAEYTGAQLSGARIYAGDPFGFPTGGRSFEPFSNVPDAGSTTTLSLLRQENSWFAGSFSYFLPTLKGFEGRLPGYLAELDRVVNLEPSKRNLWELLPWSWLVDWFLDVKSAIDVAEIAHSDSLVMNYGYAMRTQTCVAVQTTRFTSGPMSGLAVSTTSRYTRKERIRANPYGFTLVNSSDWNPTRWAILAALGFSRR